MNSMQLHEHCRVVLRRLQHLHSPNNTACVVHICTVPKVAVVGVTQIGFLRTYFCHCSHHLVPIVFAGQAKQAIVLVIMVSVVKW